MLNKPIGEFDVPNSPITQGVKAMKTSILSKITKGKYKTAQKTVIYGPEGVGKTTLASKFPNPLIIDVEKRTAHIDVARIPVDTYENVIEVLNELLDTDHGYKTIIIDTIDWLEVKMKDYLCKEHGWDSIEDPGYQKGYTFLAELVFKFMNNLSYFIEQGIHVVLVGHSAVQSFELPDQKGKYDRYTIDLEKKVTPVVKEWADNIFFINWKTRFVNDIDDKKGTKTKKKALGSQDGFIFTTRTAAYDAKNSHELAEELPLDYSAIASVFDDAPVAPVNTNTASTANTQSIIAEDPEEEPAEVTEGPAEGTREFLYDQINKGEDFLHTNKVKGFTTPKGKNTHRYNNSSNGVTELEGMETADLEKHLNYITELANQLEGITA